MPRNPNHPSKPSSQLLFWLKKPAVRLVLLIATHFAIFTSIFVLSFAIRYDFSIPDRVWALISSMVVPVVIAKLTVFYFAGHFHGWWRYVSFADLLALFRAAAISMLLLIIAGYITRDLAPQIPRTVVMLDALLTILVIGSLRCTWRIFDEQLGPALNQKKFRAALLVGQDHLAGQLAGQINSQKGLDFRVRAFLATGAHRKNARLGHLPIAGRMDELADIAAQYRARDILVPSGALSAPAMRDLVERCNDMELTLRILPALEDVLQGTNDVPMRSLNINDLLKRDPVSLDREAIGNLISGRRVLVTGAGGSIGSEICRQVLAFEPAELVLLGKGENRIFSVEHELRAKHPTATLRSVIADITDRPRMQTIFSRVRPEIVIHAAAHKHVLLMEHHPGEAIKNNANGTRVLAELASEHGVDTFVLISTDKAVQPTSVMGASKAMAERVVHSISVNSDTNFCAVRFGNVLGSAGSVVPIFQDQIRRGGPITITDERMTRFFMSIPEASQLVLQAAAMSNGGEVFVLDMGEPIQIVELARDVIRLSGLPPTSIDIEFIGMRPGEKLYEELHSDFESTMETAHPKVCAVYQPPYPTDEVLKHLSVLLEHADVDEPQQIRERLFEAIDALTGDKSELVPISQDQSSS